MIGALPAMRKEHVKGDKGKRNRTFVWMHKNFIGNIYKGEPGAKGDKVT